jgi:quercetin dioxygenase-like cupin family protein
MTLSGEAADMYEKVNLNDLESRESTHPALDLRVKAIGHALAPEKMRPRVWLYESGQRMVRHRQREQEELYYVLDGRARLTVGGETVPLEQADFVVVPPEPWREIKATTELTLLTIGAPNVPDDGIVDDEQ